MWKRDALSRAHYVEEGTSYAVCGYMPWWRGGNGDWDGEADMEVDDRCRSCIRIARQYLAYKISKDDLFAERKEA